MRCPVFPFPRPAGRTLAAVVSLLVCALLWTLPADAAEADRPMRIVSLSPLLTENVFLLGAGERLVGNTSYCTKPEAAKAVAKVGSVMELSIERIIGLRPDLVLAINLSPPQQVAQLERLGLRVHTFHQPDSFAEMCDQFLELAPCSVANSAPGRSSTSRPPGRGGAHCHRGPAPAQGLSPRAPIPFSSVQDSFTHEYMVLGGGENIAGDRRLGNDHRAGTCPGPGGDHHRGHGFEDGIGGGEKAGGGAGRAMRGA